MKTEGLKDLWKLAFGDSDEVIEAFFRTAFAPERCRYLEIGGQTATALYWFDTQWTGQKFAYLYAVATHPDFRGQGLCRRLMEETHAILTEQGYDGALLMPAEAGLRQMYAKMGYRDCTAVSEITCKAGTPVSVRPVEIAEYAQLRRKYLPKGGVIQEGVNLDYLATFAKVYAGEDFVLAAVSDGRQLHGVELLGNRDAAPGILAALGYPEGTFRTPGEDIAFAMFRLLKTAAAAPGYFGLALD